MRAGLMVVIDKRPGPAAQILLSKHDDVVEALPPNRSDHPLNVCPLPCRAWSGQHLPNPEGFDLLHRLLTKDAVAVSKEEQRRCVPWKCLFELLNRPLGCGMGRHADVHDSPPLVCRWACRCPDSTCCQTGRRESPFRETTGRCSRERHVPETLPKPGLPWPASDVW